MQACHPPPGARPLLVRSKLMKTRHKYNTGNTQFAQYASAFGRLASLPWQSESGQSLCSPRTRFLRLIALGLWTQARQLLCSHPAWETQDAEVN